MKYMIKFEWLYITVLTVVLVGLFFFAPEPEQKNQILTALIGMLTLVGGYLFGKSAPDK